MPSLVPRMPFLAMSLDLLLDVDVDTGRKVDAHQRVDGLRRRVEDVDQPLVRAHLEVLPRVLVLVRGADDAIHVLLGRQRHRTYNAGTRADDGLDDLARRRVDSLMVVGLKPDADLLSRHASPTLTPVGARYPGSHSPQCHRRADRAGQLWADRALRRILRRCLPVVVHRPPRSGVSPSRSLIRDRNSSLSKDGTGRARLDAGRMPDQAQTRLKAT